MTTIVKPHWAYFAQTGGSGLASAFVAAAHGEAGFGGTPAPDPSQGPPGALLTAAAWDGPEGDRPAWTVMDVPGDGLTVSVGWAADFGSQWVPFNFSFSADAEVEVFLNGITGAWWVAENGVLRALGTRARRFPVDMADGVVSRYMLIKPVGPNDWGTPGALNDYCGRYLRHDGAPYDPVTHRSDASRNVNDVTFFTPIGSIGVGGSKPFGARLPDTMPPTLAPVFPIPFSTSSPPPPAYMGELLDLMVATDGFNLEEPPIPGWRLLKSAPENSDFFYAVPTHL